MSVTPPKAAPHQRATRTERAILQATREVLIEAGEAGLTVEGVAARAGVAKTTVYRRWSSKEELALAVLLEVAEEIVAVPDLGNVRDELIAFVNGAVEILRETLMGRVMRGLVSDFGPVNYRLLLTGGELDGQLAERIVDAVLPGISSEDASG